MIVSETGTYQLQITVPCGLSTAAVFAYTIPTPFSAICMDSNCVLTDSQHFTINNAVGTQVSPSGSLTLTFYMVNPPTTQAVPSTSTFTIVASDPSYVSFTLTASLSSTVVYQAGTLGGLTVSSSSAQAAASATYTLSMTANHKILSGSSIIFTFPSTVNTASATLGTVTVGGATITGCSFSVSTLTVSSLFSANVAKGTTFSVVLNSVTNPTSTGTFSGFGAAIKYGTYSIDSIISGSVVISTPASGTLGISLGDQTNYAINTYTFTVTSPFQLLSAGASQIVSVQIPTDISQCDATTVAVSTSGVTSSMPTTGNPFGFNIAITSAITSFVFTVQCQNPLTTMVTGVFTLTLSTTVSGQILTATKTVQTSIGRSITLSSSVSNTPQYPSTSTLSQFSITRAGGQIAINRIQVQVPFADTSVTCTVSVGTPNCHYSNGYMMIDYTTPTPATYFTISNIGSTNPSSQAIASGQVFELDTYVLNGGNYYLADHLTSAGSLTVACTAPCKTCTSTVTYCTSCLNQGASVYLYTDTGTCGSSSCGTGYLPDTTNFLCNKCTSPCLACTGSVTYCSSCINTAQFVLNGVCVASCGTNYFAPTGSQICQQCSSPCLSCTLTSTNCVSCLTGYYSNGLCVTTCPDHTYGASGQCQTCDASCYNCSGSSTICTSCYLGSYLSGTSCVTAAVCTSDNQHVAVNSICTPCTSPCQNCQTSATQCTSCTGVLLLYGNTCVTNCPTNYFVSNSQCLACSSTCNGCVGTSTTCLACQTGYLVQTTQQCVIACASNYYISGSNCLLCDTSCNTCSQNSMSCTSCPVNLYLYSNKCVNSCPASSYAQGTTCIQCSTSCATCTGISTSCTSCAANMYLNSNTCVSTCPSGMTPISATCQACTGQCGSCAGATSYCTSCITSTLYLYAGACYTNCPTGTLASQNTTALSCVSCTQGCDNCAWASQNSTNQTCSKCSSTYKMLNISCYYLCPSGYTTSTDGLSCVAIAQNNTNNNNTNNNNTNNNSTNNITIIPTQNGMAKASSPASIVFPNFIALALFFVIGLVGIAFDHRSLILSNIVALWSVVFFAACGLQTFLSYLESDYLLLLVSGGVFAVHVILNLGFYFAYCSKISQDKGFINWVSLHGCIKCLILTFSLILSYQINRFYYSRFLGFSLFFVQFADISEILVPVNCFSLLSIITCNFPIIIIDAYRLIQMSYGSQLYSTVIETIVIASLIIIIIGFDMAKRKEIQDELGAEANYTAIKDDSKLGGSIIDISSRPFNEEEFRRKLLEDVLIRIGNSRSEPMISERGSEKGTPHVGISFKGKKLKRRNSLPTVLDIEKESDPKNSHSYPCSPKTAKDKEIPLRKYGINTDIPIPPESLPDNVYCEAAPEKGNVINVKETSDEGVQSPPFDKINAFEKHIKDNEKRKKRNSGKLFEPKGKNTPLEVIQETLEEPEENPKVAKKEDVKKVSEPEQKVPKNPHEELKSVVVEQPIDKPPSQRENIPEENPAKNIEKPPAVVNPLMDAKEVAKQGEKSVPIPPRNIQSPPQKAPEIADTVLSKPLKPFTEEKTIINENKEEKKEEKRGDIKAEEKIENVPVPVPEVKKIDIDSTASKVKSPVIEHKKEEIAKNAMLTEKIKTPEIFEDDGKYDFSLKNVSPEKVEDKKIEEIKKEEKKPEVPEIKNPILIPQAEVKKIEEQEIKKVEEPVVNDVEEPVVKNVEEHAVKKVEGPVVKKEEEPVVKKVEEPVVKKEEKPEFKAVDEIAERAMPIPKKEIETRKEEKKIELKKEPDPKKEEKKIEIKKEEEEVFLDEADLMGSFDRDDVDNSIIIRENADGQLVDIRGRKVNKHGHLIDANGNIINRKGDIIFTKAEADKEYGDPDIPKPQTAVNPLFPDEKPKPTEVKQELPKEEKKGDPIEDYKDEVDSTSRKSVTVDSLMEDTPSNYNVQNQRYDDPLEKIKQKNPREKKKIPQAPHPEEVEADNPIGNDPKAQQEYGMPAKPPKRKLRKRKENSKSANKTGPQKLFKMANKNAGYVTDEENKKKDLEETKEKVLEKTPSNKPMTARSNLPDQRPESKRRTQSRQQSPKEEEKEVRLEDMFLPSDDEDEKSIDSVLRSNASKSSIKPPGMKGLEDIYLQRLESSKKHNKNIVKKPKLLKKATDASKAGRGSESERDEISSLLNENYAEMQSQFNKNLQPSQKKTNDDDDPKSLFPGNKKLYPKK